MSLKKNITHEVYAKERKEEFWNIPMKSAHKIEEQYQNNNTITATFNLYSMNFFKWEGSTQVKQDTQIHEDILILIIFKTNNKRIKMKRLHSLWIFKFQKSKHKKILIFWTDVNILIQRVGIPKVTRKKKLLSQQ